MPRYPCVVCKKTVRQKQHALECEKCFRWQHRLCNTDITLDIYRLVTKGELDITFQCDDCEEIVRPCSDAEVVNTPDEQQERDTSMVEPLEESLGPVNMVVDSKPDLSDLNSAFHIDNEDSDFDTDICESFRPATPVTYEIMENGSKRRCKKLFSSDGYNYVVKKSTTRSTSWRCSVRSKSLHCRATVTQRGDNFTLGSIPHAHSSDPVHVEKLKIRAEVFRAADVHVTKSAGDVVKEKMKAHTCDSDLPTTANLIRAVNRQRQMHRQKEQKNKQLPRAPTVNSTRPPVNTKNVIQPTDYSYLPKKANLIRMVNRIRQKMRQEQQNMKISQEVPRQQQHSPSPRRHLPSLSSRRQLPSLSPRRQPPSLSDTHQCTSHKKRQLPSIFTHSEKKRRVDFVSRMLSQLQTQIESDSDSDLDFV